MTLEEKLAKFSETLAKETMKQSDKAVSDYKNTLTKNFEKHKEEALKHSKLQIEHTNKSYIKDKVKYIASTNMSIKKTLSKKSNELKEKLYSETLIKLNEYKKTNSYINTLNEMIKKVSEYANGENVIILVDETDKNLIVKLHDNCKYQIQVSNEQLFGGICGYMPKNKVLINLSFRTKLRDLIDDFNWDEEALNE